MPIQLSGKTLDTSSNACKVIVFRPLVCCCCCFFSCVTFVVIVRLLLMFFIHGILVREQTIGQKPLRRGIVLKEI